MADGIKVLVLEKKFAALCRLGLHVSLWPETGRCSVDSKVIREWFLTVSLFWPSLRY